MQSAVNPGGRRLFAAIALLALCGIAVSGIALQRHYAKSATTYCDLGEKFNCDIVNRSEWSTVMGIPVAGVGVAGYTVLLVLSTYLKSRPETANRLLRAATAGLIYALYLTYIEAYELATWCILCLTSLLLIFLITVLSGMIKLRIKA